MSKRRVAANIAVLVVTMLAGIGCKHRVALTPEAIAPAPPRPAPVQPYLSTCVIKASRAVVLDGCRADEPPHLTAEIILNERMLTYEAVMIALADTDMMGEVEIAAEKYPDRRGKLEDELHRRVVRNTKIEALGESGVLFKISHRGDTPDHAVDVLRRLVSHFVENAFMQELYDARTARERAIKDLFGARNELEVIEKKIPSFLQKHPEMHTPNARDKLVRVAAELMGSELRTARLKGRHAYRAKQLDAETDQAKKGALEAMIHELAAGLAAEAKVQRKLRLDKAQLEKEAAALPALEGELIKLTRAKTAAEEHLANALKKFKAADEAFSRAVEGMISFKVIRPARRPHARSRAAWD